MYVQGLSPGDRRSEEVSDIQAFSKHRTGDEAYPNDHDESIKSPIDLGKQMLD